MPFEPPGPLLRVRHADLHGLDVGHERPVSGGAVLPVAKVDPVTTVGTRRESWFPYSGIFPCFFGGRGSRFCAVSSRARISLRRVIRGSMISST